MDLIALRKYGVSYNPHLKILDWVQAYLDRIKNNRYHRLYGGRVLTEDLNLDPRTADNIVILNNKDLLAAIDWYELNSGKNDGKQKRLRLNYPLATQRKLLKRTPELKIFNAFL
jgi:hypothetical protein